MFEQHNKQSFIFEGPQMKYVFYSRWLYPIEANKPFIFKIYLLNSPPITNQNTYSNNLHV